MRLLPPGPPGPLGLLGPLGIAFLVLAASPALAERPADVLARLRGAPSTNAGALGSAFPQQYVDAYRHARPPRIIIIAPRPRFVPDCESGRLGVNASPAPRAEALPLDGGREIAKPPEVAPQVRGGTTLAPALPRR